MSQGLWKSTIQLIIFGFIAKLIATLAKILTVRIVGPTAMGYYSLVMPMMVLIITFAQLGLPSAVSRLVATHPMQRRRYFVAAFLILIVTGLGLMISLMVFGPWLSRIIFQNEKTLPTIYALALLPPLVALSGLLKGYLVGCGDIEPTALSQIFEELGRIVFIIGIGPLFVVLGPEIGAAIAMLGICIGEVFQSIYLIFVLFRKIKQPWLKFKQEWQKTEEITRNQLMAVALPMTSGRIIGSITYFLEPVLLTWGMMRLGYSTEYISFEYGILVSYAMPLLLMPGFFAGAFSTVLLPSLSRSFAKKDLAHSRQLVIVLTALSGIIGFVFALASFLFPRFLLWTLFRVDLGAEYVRLIAFPFVFYYLEAPLSTAMFALGQDKKALQHSLIANMVRLMAEIVLISRFQINAVAIATIASVLVVVILNARTVFGVLFTNQKPTFLQPQSQK